jgi:hypothetical protein
MVRGNSVRAIHNPSCCLNPLFLPIAIPAFYEHYLWIPHNFSGHESRLAPRAASLARLRFLHEAVGEMKDEVLSLEQY